MNPPPNAAGWNKSDVTVTWTVTDAESSIQSSTGCASMTLTTDTAATGTTLTCSATNAVNLTASQSVTVRIDKTPPAITGTRAPAPNPFGWNNTDVTVSFTCTDALSGVASCSAASVVTAEGADQARTGTAYDVAGNSATATVGGINIDKTPPILSCNSATPNLLWPPDHRLVGVSMSVEATDNLSGALLVLQSATSNEPDNGLGDGDTPGDIQGFVVNSSSSAGLLRAERAGTGNGRLYTFGYGASDRAGNSASSCSLQVAVPRDRGR